MKKVVMIISMCMFFMFLSCFSFAGSNILNDETLPDVVPTIPTTRMITQEGSREMVEQQAMQTRVEHPSTVQAAVIPTIPTTPTNHATNPPVVETADGELVAALSTMAKNGNFSYTNNQTTLAQAHAQEVEAGDQRDSAIQTAAYQNDAAKVQSNNQLIGQRAGYASQEDEAKISAQTSEYNTDKTTDERKAEAAASLAVQEEGIANQLASTKADEALAQRMENDKEGWQAPGLLKLFIPMKG